MKDKELMTKLVSDFDTTLKEENLIGVMIVAKEDSPDIRIASGGSAKQVGTLIATVTAKLFHFFEQYGEEKDFVQAVTALRKADVATTIKFNAEE